MRSKFETLDDDQRREWRENDATAMFLLALEGEVERIERSILNQAQSGVSLDKERVLFEAGISQGAKLAIRIAKGDK